MEENSIRQRCCYVPPGHTPKVFADTEIVGFSPTAELDETMPQVAKNLEAWDVVVGKPAAPAVPTGIQPSGN